MRPLIVSFGPDELGSIKLNTSGNLALGEQCGDPSLTDPDVLAGGFSKEPPPDDNEDWHHDNITNFDEEAKR
jgi:hypothetical protein